MHWLVGLLVCTAVASATDYCALNDQHQLCIHTVGELVTRRVTDNTSNCSVEIIIFLQQDVCIV